MNENIFNQSFETRDELNKALDAQIVEKDGAFVVGGDLARAFDDARKNGEESKKYRNRAQAAEKSLAEANDERDGLQSRLNALLELKPEETRARLQEFAAEKARLESEVKELPALKAKIEAYESQRKQATIRDELRDAARALNVREEALRDVDRLSALFDVDEIDGSIRTRDGGKSASEALAAEIALSPHWLKPSTSGGAVGSSNVVSSGEEKRAQSYDEARQKGDVLSMIKYAPKKD